MAANVFENHVNGMIVLELALMQGRLSHHVSKAPAYLCSGNEQIRQLKVIVVFVSILPRLCSTVFRSSIQRLR